jgi:formylglycine-generating enzyme required for sulfatase activity
MADLTGQSIGRYQIISRLGEGGMATVYKARDTRLDRDVALKLIRVDQFAPAMMGHILARFEREAKSLARLSHNSIVRVYDYGEHDGAPYLVLEFCGGGDLKQRLSGQPMDWREAIGLILPVARALRYSHQQGVIHRDVKPSNIMFNTSGEPMLSDFGIAKMLETDDAATLTGTGVGIGTPGYMAPEQWTGETSPQSDQYGLGVVLYELLTGRKPYESDTPAGILIKQTSEPLPLPSKFAPEIPPDVEVALLKSLNRETAERYADMAEFIKALEYLLQQTPVVETKPAAIAVLPPAADTYKTLDVVVTEEKPSPVTPADWATTADPLPKRKPINWKPVIIGGAALVVMAGIFWGVTQLPKGFTVTPEPSATPTRTTIEIQTKKPSETFSPTPTTTPTPSPTLKIGETRVSDKDGMVMVNVGDYLVDQIAITNSMFEAFVQDTGYETEVEKTNSGFVHNTEQVCPTWTVCEPGVPGRDTRYLVTTWKKAKVNWRSWNSDGTDSVVQISQADAASYCKWAGRRLLTEEEYLASNSLVKESGLYEWVIEKKIVSTGLFRAMVAYGEYPEITTPDYSLDVLTFRCASSVPPATVPAASTPEPTPAPVANALPEEIVDEKGVTMRLVPAGEFIMGSENGEDDEKPAHTVTLDDYYMDVYEVTNAQYAACVDAGVCTAPSNSGYRIVGVSDFPVTYVDWNQAKSYCEWRGAKVPTEAEWEKAARGTDGRTYPWGEGVDCSKANYYSCKGSKVAVGSYESGKSPYGMYDMAGNVWEWVNDWYDGIYYQGSPAVNPQGPANGTNRVRRGGAWYENENDMRSSFRGQANLLEKSAYIGFRCSRLVPEAPEASAPGPTLTQTSLQSLAGAWHGSCRGEVDFLIEQKDEGYVVTSCNIDTGKGSTYPISYQFWKYGNLSWTCPHMVPYDGPPFYTNTNRPEYYFFHVKSQTTDALQLSLTVTVDYPSADTLYTNECSVQRSVP